MASGDAPHIAARFGLTICQIDLTMMGKGFCPIGETMPDDIRQRIDAARASMVSVALQLDLLAQILPEAIANLRDAQTYLEGQLEAIADAVDTQAEVRPN